MPGEFDLRKWGLVSSNVWQRGLRRSGLPEIKLTYRVIPVFTRTLEWIEAGMVSHSSGVEFNLFYSYWNRNRVALFP